jgi:hypothetical protein
LRHWIGRQERRRADAPSRRNVPAGSGRSAVENLVDPDQQNRFLEQLSPIAFAD